MPSEKKKAPPAPPPALCTPTSRRLLHSLTIHDIPQGRIICMPSSLSPSPSVSRMCICDQEECCPPTCCHLKNNQDALRNGQRPEQQKLIESSACKDEVAAESIPCCRDILRKLAQDVLAFSDSHLDKRVCVRDNKSEATPPCCISSKPVTSLPECSIKTCPISKSSYNSGSKKDSCCDIPDCQDTELFGEPTKPIRHNDIKSTHQEKPVVPKEELCSITSCAREFSLKSSKWTNTDSENSSTQLDKQSDYAANGTPKLRAMPLSTPAPSRKPSASIGKNSSMKLIGGTSKSDVKNEEAKQKKSSFKLFGRSSKSKVKNDEDKEESKKSKSKEDKKKKNNKRESLTERDEACTNNKCKTKTCTCRFPPAYNEYYDCTGQISGTCHCERDNFRNDM